MKIKKNHSPEIKEKARIIQLSASARHERPSNLAKEDPFLHQIHGIIEEQLTDFDLDVSKLCQLAAVSRTQLHRKLTELAGMSATEYIRCVRLNRAKDLLRDTSLSVTAIAFDTGFGNPNYFSRAFSDLFGMSPTEYRKEG